MTESPIKDLADGISKERLDLADELPRVRAIAARMREHGFDHEARELEAMALRRRVSIDAIAVLADGLLEVTQVGMDLADLAETCDDE